MEHILKLTEEEACKAVREVIKADLGAWDIHFIEEQGHLRLDEKKPIICEELNLELFSEAQKNSPENTVPNCKIIGTCGDDEFAWVCQKDDGCIVEVDEYDLRKGGSGEGLSFPSVPHYLLFVVGYQG
jgi:hypothetical protein